MRPAPPEPTRPDHQTRYEEASAEFGPALVRLARSYESDPDRRQDLLQELHFALWRSLASFDGRCSLRTWVYRVAHNVATSHVVRDRRHRGRALVGLDALEEMPNGDDAEEQADARSRLEWLARMLTQLQPLDRQLVLLYLEGLEAAAIGEVTGLSPSNVATKIHRIKKLLAGRARTGARDGAGARHAH
jgi:RNA polymerase sigma-70 factor, ECF subfamily